MLVQCYVSRGNWECFTFLATFLKQNFRQPKHTQARKRRSTQIVGEINNFYNDKICQDYIITRGRVECMNFLQKTSSLIDVCQQYDRTMTNSESSDDAP